jgi:hypothetical protein
MKRTQKTHERRKRKGKRIWEEDSKLILDK